MIKVNFIAVVYVGQKIMLVLVLPNNVDVERETNLQVPTIGRSHFSKGGGSVEN